MIKVPINPIDFTKYLNSDFHKFQEIWDKENILYKSELFEITEQFQGMINNSNNFNSKLIFLNTDEINSPKKVGEYALVFNNCFYGIKAFLKIVVKNDKFYFIIGSHDIDISIYKLKKFIENLSMIMSKME